MAPSAGDAAVGVTPRNARRTSPAAYWAAIADALPVLQDKLKPLAEYAVAELDNPQPAHSAGLRAAQEAAALLDAERDISRPTWSRPSWSAVAAGERPPEPTEAEPGEWKHGWQYYASSTRETYHQKHRVLPPRFRNARALILSQSGPKSGRALTALPTSEETQLKPLRLNVILRRRLRLRLPFGQRFCRCGAELDPYGDHLAACPKSGLLKRRAMPQERTWRRIFTEAGAVVQKNQKLADMKLAGVSPMDDRQVEIMATGLPLYQGLPLVCDASLVSPVKANGIPRPRAAHEPGIAIANIEDVKATTYPELVSSTQCKFLVLAGEVGGRWSATTCRLLRDLAAAKSQNAAPRLRKSAAFAWENRWWSMISVATQNALAATLVDDAPHMLHAWEGTAPPLGILLHGEAPAESRLPLR